MSSTRADIRQGIANKVGAVVATVGSATTVLINDTDDEQALFQGNGGPDYTGWWIVIPSSVSAADRVRRVAAHDPNIGTIKPSRPWSIGPTAGWTYELWPPDMRPGVVEDALNNGLKRLTYLVEETVAVVTGTNNYALAYAWLQNERDVLEVYNQFTSSNVIVRNEYPWFKVTRNGTAFTLRLWPTPSNRTGSALIVEGRAHYTSLATDATTTNCPLDWAVAAGAVELFRSLRQRTAGQDVSRWREELGNAQRELRKQTIAYAPRRGRRVMTRTPQIMSSGTQVQRGEFYY